MPTPQQFVDKWKRIQLTERSSAQSHFIDLCQMLGVPTPTDEDPTGEFYTFEKGATKLSGEDGWADVWKKGYFAWEYKRNRASLEKAYNQLLQYRESLENPPLLVVSDNLTIEIHTNFYNTVKKITRLTIDDLLDPHKLSLLRNVFTNFEAFRTAQTLQEATEQAATEFARLADLLRKRGVEPDRAAHFLIRLLFCLFAEDVQLLPNNIFTKLVQGTEKTPANHFVEELRSLFTAMKSGGMYYFETIPHFNGGLFNDEDVIELDNAAKGILLKVCKLDWSNIEPAILGTLFERSLDPNKRAQLGAHYTNRDDILLIVEPVLITPLRRRWAEVQEQARALAAQRDAATNSRQRADREKPLVSLLTGFSDEIASVQVLDPACGSGNFLYVALKQLLDLQKEVAIFAMDVGLSRLTPSVSPEQLHGIEINEYAHELAQATVWIGYIQWWWNNGFGFPPEPILKPLHNILHMDAILAYDDQGRPTEPEWPKADIVIGNPPFLGEKKMRSELKDKYVDDIRSLYAGRVPGSADLVIYWFERARELIANNKIQKAGLIATQGIRGGKNRTVLNRVKQSGDIFMAWSDRPWIQEGVAVHVSIVGFDNGKEPSRTLNGLSVQSINANLTGALDLTTAQRLQENIGIAAMGDIKVGAFDIDAATADLLLAAKGNPNGRPNSDVIRPWVNGLDITGRSRNMWIIDFGTDMPEHEAALYELPFEYIRQRVKPLRVKNKMKKRAAYWWIHGDAAPRIREMLKSLNRYIGTPRLTKHRLFVYLNANILPDGQLIVFARDDDYFFGILHSKVHELWARGQGTQLREAESGFRYTPTSTFETFPFPWPPGKELIGDKLVGAIAQAARELIQKRDNWLNPPGADEAELKKRTLTNLYNQRPEWLDMAHKKLDKAVLEAYGWPLDLTDDQILERLLALNLERAANQGEILPTVDQAEDEEPELGGG
jgi:type II restriction/modification system DNA methylase subunit YeeA